MKLPTLIDGSFTWNQERMTWVQADTGLTVTDLCIRDVKIPITAEAQENQRKVIEALHRTPPSAASEVSQRMTREERIEFIKSLEKDDE